MRTNRLEHDDALRTAIKKVACFGETNGDCGPREALMARNACTSESLPSSQARRVDERKIAHVIDASSEYQSRHQARPALTGG
jgi:hypothetical protein